MSKVLVSLSRDVNCSGPRRWWSKLDVQKYFLAARVAKFWNSREKLRNLLPYTIRQSQSISHVAGECAAKPSQEWWGTGSPLEVLPDILIVSIIVYISISLEILYILLRAPHHEPEHISFKAEKGTNSLCPGERTLIKSPSRCIGLKYFSN